MASQRMNDIETNTCPAYCYSEDSKSFVPSTHGSDKSCCQKHISLGSTSSSRRPLAQNLPSPSLEKLSPKSHVFLRKHGMVTKMFSRQSNPLRFRARRTFLCSVTAPKIGMMSGQAMYSPVEILAQPLVLPHCFANCLVRSRSPRPSRSSSGRITCPSI